MDTWIRRTATSAVIARQERRSARSPAGMVLASYASSGRRPTSTAGNEGSVSMRGNSLYGIIGLVVLVILIIVVLRLLGLF
jgi:hypothetical protein